MRKVIIFLLSVCTVSALQAKNWAIIGKALENDTTLLVQDATNLNVYKYIGKISTGKFKLSDGTNVYIPVCGMNDPMGQKIGMEIQTDTNQTGFGVKYVNPTKMYIITLTTGANPTLEVKMAETYKHLYLIGGPVNSTQANWQLRDAVELEKDTADQFVFYYRGFLIYNSFGDEPGSIKFLTSNISWANAFHPAGIFNVELNKASKMRLNGNDTKWQIPADGSGNGYYIIRLNTLEETIEVLQFTPGQTAYPNKIYITGDAFPCGWSADAPETMAPINIIEGKYKWEGNVVAGQFKFLKIKGSWGSCYVSTVEDQVIEFGKEYPIVFEYEYWNGGGNDYKFVFDESTECTISLNLSTMKMVVHSGTTHVRNTIDKQSAQYNIIGHNGMIRASSSDLSPKKIVLYNYVGQKVYANNFVLNTEFSFPKGFYIAIITDTQRNIYETAKLVL
ncbi:MAG: SusF/SusE family outer membrane protein [Bacteroidales bacterium]|nr:SusF/SusE family outer membrane protein [Bacteroidales bacterium]